MRVDELVRFGFPRRAVKCLQNDGLLYLLPLQVEAVQTHGLLQGKSLLISGPTSSGKTLCGELAALRSVFDNKKAILSAPLKALAAEKYHELKKRYRKAGIKIIIVTSDYPENKRRFEKGEYDLAIVVYEMFDSLTLTSLSALEAVGTVIFDEFQLATSSDRGLAYEAVISKVRNHPSRIQIIGLIGGLNECGIFSKWLNMPLLSSTSRPVELHRGVLFNGKFSYRRYNDCFEGVEYFTCEDKSNDITCEGKSIPRELFCGVKHLVEKGEQVLIFVHTRNACSGLAAGLAELLSLPPAENILASLADIPDTIQKSMLMECLKKGVGFHNADLGKSYRILLEDGFRSGEIRALVSTTTLAMGVNLPSRNVFLEAVKYYDGFNGETVLKPLLMYDYNQIAGRAGRLGKIDNFGRAIIIADDETCRERIWDSYIYGSADVSVQTFDTEKLANLLLRWICCGLVKDYNDTKTMFAECLRGYCEGFKDNVPSMVIDLLSRYSFIEIKGCRLSCSSLGKVVAGHNISLDTAARIKDCYKQYNLKDELISWLFILADIPEAQKLAVNGRSMMSAGYEVIDDINMLAADFDEIPMGPLAEFIDAPDSSVSPGRIQMVSLLAELIKPVPAIELEMKYNTGWGRIKHIGENYANLLRAAADIREGAGLSHLQIQNLQKYADCLYHGLSPEGLTFAKLRAPFLERDFILRLNNAGMVSPSDIINAGFDVISALLPQRVADMLYKKCLKILSQKSRDDKSKGMPHKETIRSKKNGTRYTFTINDATISLQPRLYSYFHKLYNADNPDGWLDKRFLDNGNNQVKYIYKLRKELKPVPGVAIESDGAGRYRLVIRAT